MAGIIKRRGRGTPTVIAVSIVAGILNGLWIIGALLILVRLRTLVLDALSANVNGVLNFMAGLPVSGEGFRQSTEQTRALFNTAIAHWPVLIMVYSIFTIVVVSLVGWWALGRVALVFLTTVAGAAPESASESPVTKVGRTKHRSADFNVDIGEVPRFRDPHG
jgi:hypothetical protein